MSIVWENMKRICLLGLEIKLERERVTIHVPLNPGLNHGLVSYSKVIANLGITHSTLYFCCAKTPQNYDK